MIWAFFRRTLETFFVKGLKKIIRRLGVLAHLFKIPGCIYPVILKRFISRYNLLFVWRGQRAGLNLNDEVRTFGVWANSRVFQNVHSADLFR